MKIKRNDVLAFFLVGVGMNETASFESKANQKKREETKKFRKRQDIREPETRFFG